MAKIRVAIAGVGNCAASLLQGIEYYRRAPRGETLGLMHEAVGGYRPFDIEAVAAFDIDRRKVGRRLDEAALAPPNCTRKIADLPPSKVTVRMGPILDGVAPHMREYPPERTFLPADEPACDVAAALREARAEVLVNYMPVGAQRATEHYARACLEAGCAMVNCMPVFIASDEGWAAAFRRAGLPIIGDDVKSQVGATIVHRVLARLFADRGVRLDRTYQLNFGGNTDFLNMLDRSRLCAKKTSKTEAVASELDAAIPPERIHIGPSDYVPWQRDNKVCFIRIEGRGFAGVPLEIDLRLSVEDSPNSGGVAIDAIRIAKVALERGIAGPLYEASAYLMKRPAVQMSDARARERLEAFVAGGAPWRPRPGTRRAAARAEGPRWVTLGVPAGASGNGDGSSGNGNGDGFGAREGPAGTRLAAADPRPRRAPPPGRPRRGPKRPGGRAAPRPGRKG
jgi:myo-inositol-1-phosphate synthase